MQRSVCLKNRRSSRPWAKEVAGKIFNGNVGSDLKTFTGLATRYSSTSAGNGGNVILAGGSGADNASVYLVVWGEQTVFATYPKVRAAVCRTVTLARNRCRTQTAIGTRPLAPVPTGHWPGGQDWRYVVRIANIDVSDWIGITGTQADTAATNLIKLLTRAIARIPNFNMGRAAFYANRSIREA